MQAENTIDLETNVTTLANNAQEKNGRNLHQAETALKRIYHHPRPATANDVSTVLLQTPLTDAHYQELRSHHLDFFQAHHSTVLRANCQQPAIISFWPLRTLLEQVIPTINREAPDLINAHATELEAIHPQLMQTLGIHAAMPLAQIGLTPSERRSHRESEQLFRMINGFCDLLICAQRTCPSFNKAPLVIWWEDLHLADRPTLLTFRRLNHWVTQSGAPILLVGTFCPVESHTKVSTSDDTAQYLNWQALHHQMVNEVRSQLFAEEIVISNTPGLSTFHLLPDGEETVTNGVSDHSLNEAQATLLASHFLQRQDIVKGTAYALQAMRLAVFNLNLEGVLFLSHQVLALLTPDDFDIEEFKQVWKTLTAGEHYAALEFSVSSDIKHTDDILIAIWKAVALVHTFASEHQKSVECYQRALVLARTPTMQAQLYMYLGLITGKRLYKIEEARAYLNKGLALVEGMDGAEAALEYSWLLNVSALMAFQTKEYRNAMSMVQKGLSNIKAYHESEVTHLKVNLISNISVLLESTRQFDQALKTWHFFQDFLGTANEIFAKHYYFREGGLLLKMNNLTETISCYEQSYEQAKAVHDKFHMKVIASACGYVCYHLGKMDEAYQWYAKSAQMGEEIGDYGTLPECLIAQAICCHHMGNADLADALLQQAIELCSQLQLDLLKECAEEIQHSLTKATPDMLDRWTSTIIKPMGTKLNRPFYLINLYN